MPTTQIKEPASAKDETALNLFETYQRTQDASQLIEYYRYLINYHHKRAVFNKPLPPTCDADDIKQEMFLELLKTFDRYQPDRGKLESYASRRLEKEIVDILRKESPKGRRLLKGIRKIRKAEDDLTQQLNRFPTDKEISAIADLSPDQIKEIRTMNYQLSDPISIEEIFDYESEHDHSSFFLGELGYSDLDYLRVKNQLMLKQTIKKSRLTEKEQIVLLLYYYENLTQKEITKILNLSEARISQLHTQALQKIRKTLGINLSVSPPKSQTPKKPQAIPESARKEPIKGGKIKMSEINLCRVSSDGDLPILAGRAIMVAMQAITILTGKDGFQKLPIKEIAQRIQMPNQTNVNVELKNLVLANILQKKSLGYHNEQYRLVDGELLFVANLNRSWGLGEIVAPNGQTIEHGKTYNLRQICPSKKVEEFEQPLSQSPPVATEETPVMAPKEEISEQIEAPTEPRLPATAAPTTPTTTAQELPIIAEITYYRKDGSKRAKVVIRLPEID